MTIFPDFIIEWNTLHTLKIDTTVGVDIYLHNKFHGQLYENITFQVNHIQYSSVQQTKPINFGGLEL